MTNNFKRALCTVLALIILASLAVGCTGKNPDQNENTPGSSTPEVQNTDNKGENTVTNEKVYATIEMEDGGIIKLELYPEIAPQSVYNFVSLARKGFYDGLIFHRVISGFMIQGGDPEKTGMGGPGYHIKGEFAANGFKNDLKHTRGVISFARGPRPDSAGSQFFIMHQDAPHLDGNYAAFGMVIEGMDVVDRIASVRVNLSNNRPLTDVVIKTITIEGPELPEPEKLN